MRVSRSCLRLHTSSGNDDSGGGYDRVDGAPWCAILCNVRMSRFKLHSNGRCVFAAATLPRDLSSTYTLALVPNTSWGFFSNLHNIDHFGKGRVHSFHWLLFYLIKFPTEAKIVYINMRFSLILNLVLV